MKGQKLDELLKQALQSFRPSVEDDDWERIAASLDGKTPATEKRSGFGWGFTATVLVSGLLLWLLPSLDIKNHRTGTHPNAVASVSTSEIKNNVGLKDKSYERTSSVENKQREETGGMSPAPKLSQNETGSGQKTGAHAGKKTSAKPLFQKPANKSTASALIKTEEIIPQQAEQKKAPADLAGNNKTTDTSNSANVSTETMAAKEVITKGEETANNKTPEAAVSRKGKIPEDSNMTEDKILTLTTSDSTIDKTITRKVTSDVFSKGWLVGISITPQFAYRNLTMNNSAANKTHKNYEQLRNGQDKPMPAFSFNLYAECKITASLGFQTGVTYAQSGYMAQYNYKVNEVPVIDSATRRILGYVYVNDATGTRLSSRQTFSYAEIPFLVGYTFNVAPRFRMGIRAGGSIQKLQMVNATIIDPSSLALTKISKNEQTLRSTNFSYQLALGVYYAVKPRIYVMAEPVFKRSVSPMMNSQAISRETFFSYGLNMGIMYKLF